MSSRATGSDRPLAQKHHQHVVGQGLLRHPLLGGEAVVEGGEGVEGVTGHKGMAVQDV